MSDAIDQTDNPDKAVALGRAMDSVPDTAAMNGNLVATTTILNDAIVNDDAVAQDKVSDVLDR